MKLRYTILALAALAITTTASAQTLATIDWTAKTTTARKAANDLKQRKVRKAAKTVLDDKDVRKRVKISPATEDKLLNTSPKAALAKAKAEARKDPVAYGTKMRKEATQLRKKKFFLFRKKSKSRRK